MSRVKTDKKILIENFISLSSLKVITYVLPLISLPYLTRIIGVEKYGMISFSAAIIVFFQAFVDYGFNYTGIRDIAKFKNNKEKVDEIFSSILIIRLIFTLISAIILAVAIFIIPDLQGYEVLLFYTFLIVPATVLFPEWFFQAQETMKYVTIFTVFSRLIFTLLIFIIITTPDDYVYVPLLNSLGSLFAGIAAMAFIFFKFKVKVVFPAFLTLKHYITTGFDMFLSLIFPNFYTNISTILIESYWGKTATGVFSAGYKVIGLTSSIADVVSRVAYPYLARRLDKHSLYVRVTLIMNVLLSIILYTCSNLIVMLLFGQAFSDAIIIVKIMSITPVFLFLMNAYGTNYLVLINKEQVLRKIIVSVSVIGSILSFILIYKYSYFGAAIAISTTWMIRGGLTYFLAKKNKKNG